MFLGAHFDVSLQFVNVEAIASIIMVTWNFIHGTGCVTWFVTAVCTFSLDLKFFRTVTRPGPRSMSTNLWITFFLRSHSNFSCMLVCLLKTTRGCNHLRWYEFLRHFNTWFIGLWLPKLAYFMMNRESPYWCRNTFSQVWWGLIEVLFWAQLLESASFVLVWFVQRSGVHHVYPGRCWKCFFWSWLVSGWWGVQGTAQH